MGRKQLGQLMQTLCKLVHSPYIVNCIVFSLCRVLYTAPTLCTEELRQTSTTMIHTEKVSRERIRMSGTK